MPKTWSDGPPKTRADQWRWDRRRWVSSLGSNFVSYAADSWEDWRAGSRGDDQVERAVRVAARLVDAVFDSVPRNDGRSWSEPCETEEDGWSYSRIVDLFQAAGGYLCSKIRSADESWKAEVSDAEIQDAVLHAHQVQRAVDRVCPRLG